METFRFVCFCDFLIRIIIKIGFFLNLLNELFCSLRALGNTVTLIKIMIICVSSDFKYIAKSQFMFFFSHRHIFYYNTSVFRQLLGNKIGFPIRIKSTYSSRHFVLNETLKDMRAQKDGGNGVGHIRQ